MALQVADITEALKTDASASGLYEYVQGHPMVSAHGAGLAWWCYVSRVFPYPAASGLNSTTGVVVYQVASTLNDTSAAPLDLIDPTVVGAADALLRRYMARFTLGGLVRNVDIKGAAGQRLSMDAGWIQLAAGADGRFRSMIITLPLVVNDLWDEVP